MILIWFWIAAFFSEIVGTLAGFGSSTLFLPIALFFFDFRTALILTAIFHFSGNIGRIAFFRRKIDKKLLLFFGLPSVVLTLAGALFVNYVSQPVLKLILGLFLGGYVLLVWNGRFTLTPTKRNSIIGGGLSGFLAGLIGTGGALRGAFLTAFRLEKAAYIATAAVISLAVDLTRIPIYWKSGFLPDELVYFIPILFVIALAGSFIGTKIVRRIPQPRFKKWVLIALGLVSLKFIVDGITYLADLLRS
ncbi:sulfite exporter TauE/SafE family protein [Candidatus Woesearchaeota archaeon]|nr:sulfite exporter TauE/SafE family protein [Candidatus Woesearchaeota archaeon]